MCKTQRKRNVEILCLNCGFQKHSIAGVLVAHHMPNPISIAYRQQKLMALNELRKQAADRHCLWRMSKWNVDKPEILHIVQFLVCCVSTALACDNCTKIKGVLVGECLPGKNCNWKPSSVDIQLPSSECSFFRFLLKLREVID